MVERKVHDGPIYLRTGLVDTRMSSRGGFLVVWSAPFGGEGYCHKPYSLGMHACMYASVRHVISWLKLLLSASVYSMDM
jgi:hypothetical protein